MADPYNNPPPSGSHNPPPPPGASGEDNEPRIDGDGQEVNALRFLGAGGPPAPPAPSITPVSSGVSQQSLPPQQPPAAPQTPHNHPPSSQSAPGLIANTPGVGVGVVGPGVGLGPGGYDPYSDPSGGAYHGGHGGMQIPPGPMSGPYGGPPGAPPGMMAGGPAMMMMPSYGYGMYPSPYGYMNPYTPAPQMAPQPAIPQTQLVAMLNVLRVNNPKYYREWYKKYSAHKRNPDAVPFPPIPPVPGFPQMGGPGSSQTLPSSYGRSRKESTRSSINGDAYSRGAHDSFADYSSLSSHHVPNTSSSSRGHRGTRSGRASVNGDYKSNSRSGAGGGIPPEDDFEIEGADARDMSSLSMATHIGQNSLLHSTFNNNQNSNYPGSGGSDERDRHLTQSGRSSTIGDRLPPGDIYGDQQDSLSRYDSGLYHQQNSYLEQQQREPSPIRRMTPMKFSTFHCIATMSPLGHMIRIKNSGTVLEFIKMKQFVGHLPEYKEMESFPGPLTQISTHKNTVIQFCKRKIKEARTNPSQLDRENYILLWEFLMLMLRQNGMVVGSDIAELLLTAVQQQQQQQQQKQLEASSSTSTTSVQKEEIRDTVEGSDGAGGDSSSEENKAEGEGESSGGEDNVPSTTPAVPDPPVTSTTTPPRDEKKLVEEFCSHLLYGHKKDALDFAMDHGLWGHALFFASKMDERSYGHVLARFANGIPLQSPLQTLYHIMCGKQPASVTNCGEGEESGEAFGDWKPHLAMLLSNSGYKAEVEQRAILTLGDTLHGKSHWFAAQFCYLMGHEEFRKESRLGSLLGYCPTRSNVLEATQMTEVYEFARKLADPGFTLGVSFLQSKLDYAKRLVSYGFVEEALAYCEEITKVLRQSGGKGRGGVEPDELIKLCGNTLRIAERIAVADESGTASGTWVEELRRLAQEPGGLFSSEDGGDASSRKLSLVSSTTNQEQHSDQMSYTSSSHQQQQQQQQLPPQQMGDSNLGGGGIYDPYGQSSQQQQQQQAPSDPNMTGYNSGGDVVGGGGMMMMEGGGGQQQMSPPEVGQQQQQFTGDIMQQQQQQQNQAQDNSWGQMNGGLHLSQPPQQSPPLQQNMYDPYQQQQQQPQNDGSGYQQQQTGGMDSGYSSQGGYGGGGDKPSTINNNHWYNPYDSQPQLGGGPGPGQQHQQHQNSSPVKKKSVRFEDQPDRHGGLVVLAEGNINGTSLDGVGVQNVVRARHVGGGGGGGGSRPTTLDLKSALKTTSVDSSRQKRERQSSSLVVNGGGGGGGSHHPPSLDDLELCSSKKIDKTAVGQYFEVEYKSTYPIDEPIMSSAPVQKRQQVLQVATSPQQPVLSHPYPMSAVAAAAGIPSQQPPPRQGKTFPVDKQCCDVSQPCVDHSLDDDVLLGEEDEDDLLDDEDEDGGEDDEEGGVGGGGGGGAGGRRSSVNNNDIEGVENGGYHHRHQHLLPNSNAATVANSSGHFTRFENKTESSKPPAPASSGASPPKDKKGGGSGDKKKSSKDPKGLDGGGQQEKGWFSGLFKTLSLKPKNQMILPDDKNPTIVWDPKEQRWVNTAADGEDDSAPAGPPPKDSELMGMGGGPPPPQQQQQQQHQQQQPMMMPPQQQHHQQQQQQPQMMMGGGGGPPHQNSGAYQQQPALQQQQQPQNSLPNPSLQQMPSGQQQQQPQGMMMPGGGGGMPSLNNNNNSMNKYKLQKGRGLKGYVDVLNPNASSPAAGAPAPMQPNHQGGGGAPVPNLFIPPPMQGGGGGADNGPVSFLTAPSVEEPGQQGGGQENNLGQQQQPPPMFNPAQFHQGYPQQ